MERVQDNLPVIFNCKRVNVVLVDRYQKNFFRYKKNAYGESKRISYPIDSSLAAFVAISCQAIFTDRIKDEQRYIPEVDDPRVKDGLDEPANQMLSVPVFAMTDQIGTDLGNLPRCIIQLIDKHDTKGFTPEDISKMDYLSAIIGRIHDQLLKVEQLHCLKSVSDRLFNCTKEIDIGISDTSVLYTNVKKSLDEFLDKTHDIGTGKNKK